MKPIIIDRYILKEWLKTFGVTLMLILGILLLEDMYKNLKNFLERGADLLTLLLYYAYIIPNCFCTVLPISFFISVLYVLNDMQAHNEIVAMRASGMTVFQITRSFWGAAFLLMGLMAIFNAYLLPKASDGAQKIVQQIDYNDQKRRTGNANAIGLQSHLCLHNAKEGRLWHIAQFSLYSNCGKFVNLSKINTQGNETERITAESIIYDLKNQEWIFKNGKQWFFDTHTYVPERFTPFEQWTFKCSENPKLMTFIHKPLKYLGAHELKEILSFVPKNHPRFLEHQIKYYSILSSPLICFMVVLLAIPFSLKGVRTNPMVGVSKAAGLFFIYYIVCSIGRMLGTQNTLSPLMAAWFPNLLMLAFGLLLYRQLAPK